MARYFEGGFNFLIIKWIIILIELIYLVCMRSEYHAPNRAVEFVSHDSKYEIRQTPCYPLKVYRTLGIEGVRLFMDIDKNWDNQISLTEFNRLYFYFSRKSKVDVVTLDRDINAGDEQVTIKAEFSPLNLSTLMTSDLAPEERFFTYKNPYAGLLEWQSPSIPSYKFGVQHFKIFLPPPKLTDSLGQVYEVIELFQARKAPGYDLLRSDRHFPPPVKEEYVTVHRLLSMFHPQVFLFNRYVPRGAVALVRARNDNFIEVVFRIHAEFQLNRPPNDPFWFVPAQFFGNLIISVDHNHIESFQMHVPADRKLNVEWVNGRSISVDIGHMAHMSLTAASPSTPGTTHNEQQNNTVDDTGNFIWSSEISYAEAKHRLELEMFPFKQILQTKTRQEPILSQVAKNLLKYHRPPVTTILHFPNGTVIDSKRTNSLLGEAKRNPHKTLPELYSEFLMQAVDKVKTINDDP